MLVACPIIPAQADLITTISGGWGPGGSAFASEPDGPLYFAFGNFNIDTFHFFNYVYDDYAFRTSDVGSTFVLGSTDDPDFSARVTLMTNGLADRVGYVMAYTHIGADYGGNQAYESSMFAGSPFMTNGIDLQGSVVDNFSLHIDSMSIDSPGQNPNGDGNWTDLEFSFTLSINGHAIPEPSTLLMVCLGAIIFGVPFLRRKRAPTRGSSLLAYRGGRLVADT